MITKGMLTAAYQEGFLCLKDDPYGCGTVCEIGDCWFYFSDEDAWELSADEYMKLVPIEKTIKNIFTTLEEFRESEDDVLTDEYAYYESFLLEHEILPGKYTVAVDVSAVVKIEVHASSFEEARSIAQKSLDDRHLADLDGDVYHTEGISVTRDDGKIVYW